MRTYLDFNLKGSQIFIPVVVGLLIAYGLAAIVFFSFPGVFMLMDAVTANQYSESAYLSAELAMRNNPFYGTLIVLALYALELMIYFGVLFFIVRSSVQGLSYKGEQVSTDYDFKRYAGVVLKGGLLSFVTLGIYSPWFARNIIHFFAAGASFRFKQFGFRGKGIILFAIITLAVILPSILFTGLISALGFGAVYSDNASWLLFLEFALTICLFFILCMAEVMRLRWFVDFSYGDSKRIALNVRSWHAGWFVFGQILLCLVTFMLYYPMALLRIYRYFASRAVIGGVNIERRFGFTLNGWKDYFFVLGQLLLSFVTLGIYMPWAYAKTAARLVGHTYLDEEGKAEEPMPPGMD